MLDTARDTAKEIAGDLLNNRDIESLSIEVGYEGEDVPPATIENINSEEVLVINLDQVGDSAENQILSAASSEVWDEQGGLFDYQINDDVNLVKNAIDRSDIKSTASFFEKYLPSRDIEILRRCLYLRLEWEDEGTYTDSRHMADRKNDLRSEYGDIAGIVANLSSSGYYDEDGYLRKMFREMDRNTELTPDDYKQIYDEILTDEAFCVFVSGRDRVPMIKREINNKLSAYNNYPVNLDFVDVRAQGGKNRAKVEQAVLEIQRNAPQLHFEVWVRPRETAYRIFTDELELS